MQHIWHYGNALWVYRPVPYIFRRRSPYGMSRPSVVCLFVVCLRLCGALPRGLKFWEIFLHHLLAHGFGSLYYDFGKKFKGF